MAIFHFSAKVISRGNGQSVVAAAAYQSRSVLFNERDGQTKDYTERGQQPLLFSGIFAPKEAPDWAKERGQLWNHAEAAENRRDAQTARSFDVALPCELTPEQSRHALQDFVRDSFTRRGYVVDMNIHGPDKGGDSRNTHAHLLVTMRPLEGAEFSQKKDRSQNTPETLAQWREAWARTANRHLERHGHKARIDHRTLAAQGIEREPTQHLGPTSTQMERAGKVTERGERNRERERVAKENWQKLAALRREQEEITREITREQEKQEAMARALSAAAFQKINEGKAAEPIQQPAQALPVPKRSAAEQRERDRIEEEERARIWRKYHEEQRQALAEIRRKRQERYL